MNPDLERVRHVEVNELNYLANQPDVLPFISRDARRLDLDWVYKRPGSYVLGHKSLPGAVVFLLNEPGVYECHYLAPGHGGLRLARMAVDWLFTFTDAQAIIGNTPRDNLAARLTNRWLGGSAVSERYLDGYWTVQYELTRDKWASLQGNQTAVKNTL